MKTVFLLAALVALTMGAIVPAKQHYETKSVDGAYVERQKKIFELFYNIYQVDPTEEYYKLGFDYDIEGNAEHYTDKNVVKEFMALYRTGQLPKYHDFSIFYERQKDEAVTLFKLFYFAKDFETFYKTAAWARVHLNQGLFVYSYYIAVIQRADTQEFLLPAPYEVYPELFLNRGLVSDILRVKEQNGIHFPEVTKKFGLVKEDKTFIFYANYSDALTYPNQEERISYFTEDIGWNAYYYYFHTTEPFWWKNGRYGHLGERRGELYFYFYQSILARYYMERLSNGLGEIPSISWYAPLRVGYFPKVGTWSYPFAQRNNYYNLHTEKNYESIRFLDIFEKTFFQYLQKGHFKAFEHEYDFHDPKAMNFVGNYWQTNADLYGEDFTTGYQRSYEMTARRVLGGAPEPLDKYNFMPSALDFYQTSLRDPAFYQLYNKIFDYMVQYKQYLKPYNHEDLHFTGVKIQDVKIEKLITYFDLYDFDAINMIVYNKDEDKRKYEYGFNVRQPRLNHKSFTVSIDVKSDVATDAIFKVWVGPKYDSNGYPLGIEHNWMNFFEIDLFTHKLNKGSNKIDRSSEEFFFFKEDSLPISKVWALLEQGKVPTYMVEDFNSMPRRLMLPKGTKGGFPLQFFVFVYPQSSEKKPESKIDLFDIILGNRPFGYPLDRPAKEQYFKQPNMFFEDVYVYHEGEDHPYKYANPEYKHKEL